MRRYGIGLYAVGKARAKNQRRRASGGMVQIALALWVLLEVLRKGVVWQ